MVYLSWEIQILKSPLIISRWILLLPLVKFSLVSHYGGVICCVHITSLENVYIEILSPRIDIVDYLVPRWHVSSTSCNLLVFVVKMMLDVLVIYHRELFPNTSCLLTIGTHLCGRNYWYSLYWLLLLFALSLAKVCATPFVFHITCGSC